MSNTRIEDFVIRIVLAIGLCLCGIAMLRACSVPQPPPSVAGQPLEISFQLDLNKRYDVVCSGNRPDEITTHENVKILGYVGSQDDKQRSTGITKYSMGYFRDWLVLERVDQRRIYLPGSSISLIREVSGAS